VFLFLWWQIVNHVKGEKSLRFKHEPQKAAYRSVWRQEIICHWGQLLSQYFQLTDTDYIESAAVIISDMWNIVTTENLLKMNYCTANIQMLLQRKQRVVWAGFFHFRWFQTGMKSKPSIWIEILLKPNTVTADAQSMSVCHTCWHKLYYQTEDFSQITFFLFLLLLDLQLLTQHVQHWNVCTGSHMLCAHNTLKPGSLHADYVFSSSNKLRSKRLPPVG